MRRAGVCAALLAVAGCETPAVYVVNPPTRSQFAETAVPVVPTRVPIDTLRGRLDAAGKMHSPFDRDEALKQLVCEAAAQGDGADPAALGGFVTDALKRMNSPFDRDGAAGGSAKALARRGMTAEAVAVAGTITSPFTRDEVLKAVVTGKP